MKKLLALLFAAIFSITVCFSLISCGNGDGDNGDITDENGDGIPDDLQQTPMIPIPDPE